MSFDISGILGATHEKRTMLNFWTRWFKKPQTHLFHEILKEYVDKYKVENDLQPQTAAHYDAFYRNSCNFFSTAKLWNLRIDEIRERHAEQFRSWLRTYLTTCSVRRASRHVELWKRVTKYAVVMEYADTDYLAPIRPQRDPRKKIITLTVQEIRKIKNHPFQRGIFRTAADLFLFQCFTGLSYSDIWQHELIHRKGRYWVVGQRQKTDEEYYSPVLEEAQDIYTKYQAHLPKLSNQKYNEFLKEIAAIVGIDKRLTTHVGRKTFATLMTLNGVGVKPVSMMLGHSSTRTTEESYINNTPEIIENELDRVNIGKSILKNS